jgi:hypothetical protein
VGPVKEELSGVDAVDAADALDECRLARPVVTDEGGDLTGIGGEIHGCQRVYRTERFVDSPQFESGEACHIGYLLRWRGGRGLLRRPTPTCPSCC